MVAEGRDSREGRARAGLIAGPCCLVVGSFCTGVMGRLLPEAYWHVCVLVGMVVVGAGQLFSLVELGAVVGSWRRVGIGAAGASLVAYWTIVVAWIAWVLVRG